MGWLYLAGFIMTMGTAIAFEARKGDLTGASFIGTVFVGAIWPVAWCGVLALYIIERFDSK